MLHENKNAPWPFPNMSAIRRNDTKVGRQELAKKGDFDKKGGILGLFSTFTPPKSRIMKLSILMTRHFRLLSLAATLDVFETTNRYLEQQGQAPAFDIQLIGHGDVLPALPYAHAPVPLEAAGSPSDIVIVPAFGNGDMAQFLKANACFIPWLREQYVQGASLVSLCTGSFLLAAAGLLNERPATTHIDAIGAFERAFPEVILQPHAIVTQSDNIFTSGGATNSFHLKLLIIQQYCGRDMAIRVAKCFAIDMDRNNQLYFEYFKPSLSEDSLVRDLQLLIQQRYHELRNVEEALSEIPSSRRNLSRRFKKDTGLTPIKYLQKTKIESAKRLLSHTQKDVMDVMVLSGYHDLKSFRQLFKSFTGLTPKGYREKFGASQAS